MNGYISNEAWGELALGTGRWVHGSPFQGISSPGPHSTRFTPQVLLTGKPCRNLQVLVAYSMLQMVREQALLESMSSDAILLVSGHPPSTATGPVTTPIPVEGPWAPRLPYHRSLQEGRAQCQLSTESFGGMSSSVPNQPKTDRGSKWFNHYALLPHRRHLASGCSCGEKKTWFPNVIAKRENILVLNEL